MTRLAPVPGLAVPADPPSGLTYPSQLHRQPLDVVRPLLALLVGMFGYVLVPVVAQLVLALCWVGAGRPGDWSTWAGEGFAFRRPDGMLAANLSLALLTPVVLLALRYGALLRPAWVCSVQPGMRWRYLALVVAVSPVLAASVLLTQRFDVGSAHPQPGYWWFLVVILLTSPLQAAGEEFLFRGLLLTTLGSFTRNPWFGILASAAVFSLFHGVQSPPLFLDRFAFGVLAGVLVWRTGGLEAAIAIHAVNNVLAWGTAGLFGTIADARGTTDITWGQAAVDVVSFAVVAALAWWIGRRMKLAITTP